MKKWFSRDSKKETGQSKLKDVETFSEFKDVLDQSIREEGTQVLITKKQESKHKAMVRILLDGGYTLEDINEFLGAGKKFELRDGEIIGIE